MPLKLITPATLLPVTVADAEAHARCTGAGLSAQVEAYIRAATDAAEQITGRAIMPQDWRLTLDAFPAYDALRNPWRDIELPRAPLQAVTKLEYINSAGVPTALAVGTGYVQVDTNEVSYPLVRPPAGSDWPSTASQPDAVVIEFTAGYASAADVPMAIKTYIYLAVNAMVQNPELFGQTQQHGNSFVESLLHRYKIWSM